MPLTANFLADFSSFLTACSAATTSTDELVESAGKVGAAMDEGVAAAADSIKTAASGIADFGKSAWSVLNSQQLKSFASDVTTFASGYIKEFSEAEASTARLTQALINAGKNSPDVIAAYGDMASALQKVSTFSDEAITDAQALFTTVGKIGPDAMESTLRATMDLATFMKVDLVTAANMVAKAASSDGEALGKLKVVLRDTIPKGAEFADVMVAINKQFGGQSQAALETTAGSMENLKNQMSDVNEIIGEALADNLRLIFDLFKSLPEGLQTFIVAAVGLGTALAPVLVSLSSLVSLLSTTGLGAGIATAFETILPFLGPAGLIAAGLLALFAVWKYWDEIVAFVKSAVSRIGSFLTGDLPKAFSYVVDVVKDWYNAVRYWLVDQFGALVNYVVGLPGRIVDAFAGMYNAIAGHSYVPDMVDVIDKYFGKLDRVMVDPAWKAADSVRDAFAGDLFDPGTPSTLSVNAAGAGRAGVAGAVNVTVNMSGMLGTDDPQTRSIVSDLISNAVMQGMRQSRLLGTA